MTDENKIELKEENCKCFCQSEWFKKFLTKALAVFVGVYCALSLFAALHKPPMPPCPYGFGAKMKPCHCKMHHFHKFHKHNGEFHKKFEKGGFEKREITNIKNTETK